MWMVAAVLQVCMGVGAARAESVGCAAINALNGQAVGAANRVKTDFDPDDVLTVSLADNGLGSGQNPADADLVNVRSRDLQDIVLDHRSITGTAGTYTASTAPGFLAGRGAFVRVTARTYISDVRLRCGSASAPAPLVITTASLPALTVGSSVDLTFGASGGSTPYTFAASGGAVPDGLLLEASGRLHGTPLQAAAFSTTVTVTDAGNRTATTTYSGQVAAGVPDAPTQVVATAGDGQASVAFAAPARTGGAPIRQYIVSAPGIAEVIGSQSPILVGGLSNGVTVRFQVRADNGSQRSALSDPSAAVTPMAAQQIQFDLSGEQQVGTTLGLTATSSAGLPVQYSSQTPAVCRIVGASSVLMQAAGTCSVEATQPGSASVAPAVPVVRSVRVVAVLPAPQVTAVQVPAAGRYLPGQVLQFRVTFDQAVFVAGSPRLQITLGTQPVMLPYQSGSGSTALVFAHTVLASDHDDDGIRLDALLADAGSLRNAQGSEALPQLNNIPSTADILVGAVLPSAPMNVQALPGDGQAQVQFAPPQQAGSAAILDYTVTASPGGASVTGTASPITVGGLSNGTAYRFVVTARSAHGPGTPSQPSTAVTPQPALQVDDAHIALDYGAAATPLPLAIRGSATRVDIVDGPRHGTVQVQGTVVRYAPQPGFSGQDQLTYTASDDHSTSTVATVTITVAAPLLQIDALPVAAVTAGGAMDASLSSRGGRAPYRYAVVAGRLPAGLALDPAGRLSGTPTEAGRFAFEVAVTDSSTGNGPFSARAAMLLEVVAPSIEPGDAPLPPTPQAGNVNLQLQARGGTAPYVFRLFAGALPTGVLLSADGRLTGVARQAGLYDFDVEVRDAHGFASVLRYQLQVAQATQLITGFIADPATPVFSPGGTFLLAAQGGASAQPIVFASGTPVVCSVRGAQVTMLAAGRCSLSADQTGDDNHAPAAQQWLQVDIAAAAPVLVWSGDLQRLLEQGGFELPLPGSPSSGDFSFSSSDPTIASVSGRTVQVHAVGEVLITAAQRAAGSYAAATVSLRLRIGTRPDPTRDAAVSGLLQAQVDASVRFAATQQANIRDRLRQVRDGGVGSSTTLSLSNGAAGAAAASLPLGGMLPGSGALLPPGWGSWAAGTALYGRGGADRAGRFDLRSDGISVGVDRALGAHAVLGVAASAGRNDSDLDQAGTRMRADQRAIALYGLWRAGSHLYLDAMLARGTLQFDLQRWSRDAGAMAWAQRDGAQWSGSFGLGYEQSLRAMRLAGYLRVDGSRTTLEAYREQGLGELDLAYRPQVVDNRTLAVGLEGRVLPPPGARLRPFWNVEYRQALQDRGVASVNYVQWAQPQDYRLALRSYNDDVLSLSAGVDMAIQRNWLLTLLFGHEQARGGDRANSIGLRLSLGASPPDAAAR